MNDREATQLFAVFNLLITHCGKRLTPDLIYQMREEFKQEMTEGPTAWAFRSAEKK